MNTEFDNLFRLSVVGMLLLLLTIFPVSVSAAEEGFTMSLRPSAEVVNPGDTVQLAVQIHNDGWPDAGDAEVAAFQATLDYDRSLLEFQSVEIPEGTMGDFRPDSGIVLGYGEGHTFQENFDCAILTMKVSESASGEIPVALSHVVLGKQDATELTVSAAVPLTLYAGSAAGQPDGSGQSSDSGSVSTAGRGAETGDSGYSGTAGNGASGTDQTSGDTRTGQSAQAGAEGGGADGADPAASGNPSDSSVGASGGSSADGSVSGETGSGGSGNGESTAANDGAKDSTAENAEATGTDAGKSAAEASGSAVRSGVVLISLLAALAAAGAGVYFYRKRRRTEYENRNTD